MANTSLGIDFGTSNSAAAFVRDGQIVRVHFDGDQDTLPTAVFFPDSGDMLIGRAAAEALIEGEEGRYMRALKSVLGTPLFHEKRLIGGKRQTLADIVTQFLVRLRNGAAQRAGHNFDRVVSGRPVRFHHDPDRDARAEQDLRACYLAAGFEKVEFLFEPEAAAIASAGQVADQSVGLIVDIGGGTSDFTVFRAAQTGPTVIASHGIRLGGTDFDQSVSLAHAMPLFGLGGELRRTLGDGLLPVPRAIYGDLSNWAMIPFLYTRETERMVDDLVKHAVEPEKMHRLAEIIQERLGHDVAFAVERGKIAANSGAGNASIDLGVVEKSLAAQISAGSMNASLSGYRDDLRAAIYETLMKAQIGPQQIGYVVLVGGSSLMRFIKEEALAVTPQAKVIETNAFTAVVDGLAIAAARGR